MQTVKDLLKRKPGDKIKCMHCKKTYTHPKPMYKDSKGVARELKTFMGMNNVSLKDWWKGGLLDEFVCPRCGKRNVDAKSEKEANMNIWSTVIAVIIAIIFFWNGWHEFFFFWK